MDAQRDWALCGWSQLRWNRRYNTILLTNHWVVVKHGLRLKKAFCKSPIARCMLKGSTVEAELSTSVQVPIFYHYLFNFLTSTITLLNAPQWFMACMLLFENKINLVLRILCHLLQIAWKTLQCYKIMLENNCLRKSTHCKVLKITRWGRPG